MAFPMNVEADSHNDSTLMSVKDSDNSWICIYHYIYTTIRYILCESRFDLSYK